MKKLIVFILGILLTGALFAQNTFKYEVRANGGLRVGGSTFAEIDSITLQAGKLRIMSGAVLQQIAGHVLYTDTTTMLTKYARKASPTFSGIAKLNTDTLATQAYARANGGGSEAVDTTHLSSRIDLKLNVSDTSAMLENYALLSEVGSGASMVYPSGSGIPIVASGSSWGTTITNNSTEWNKAGVVGNGTAPPYFDGSSDGGQILTFYGDNGFWTALQGGAPTANRSYRLPIAALPGAGTTSLMNIDQYGNMGFIPSTTYAPLSHSQAQSTITNLPDSLLARYTKDQMDMILSNLPAGSFDATYIYYVLDSIRTVLADSINIEALLQIDFDMDTVASLSDVRSLAGSGVIGVTLNSGTLTLTGSDATADDITFYTNGNGEYNLPTGGGNLTIQSQVQGWINDSLDVLRTADSDTIPLFIFGLGSGHSSDTAIFNNGRLAGAFYNSGSDTLYVTELRGVLVEGTGTETIAVQVSWDVNMKDGTPTNLNTSALTVTSMTTGTADTTFDNNGIPPGVWVWSTLSGASANNKPTMLTLTMTGFRRNRSY